jgi:hypothetical protein
MPTNGSPATSSSDNRGTMHTATEYDRVKYRRLVWRTSMIGEIPLGPMAA